MLLYILDDSSPHHNPVFLGKVVLAPYYETHQARAAASGAIQVPFNVTLSATPYSVLQRAIDNKNINMSWRSRIKFSSTSPVLDVYHACNLYFRDDASKLSTEAANTTITPTASPSSSAVRSPNAAENALRFVADCAESSVS